MAKGSPRSDACLRSPMVCVGVMPSVCSVAEHCVLAWFSAPSGKSGNSKSFPQRIKQEMSASARDFIFFTVPSYPHCLSQSAKLASEESESSGSREEEKEAACEMRRASHTSIMPSAPKSSHSMSTHSTHRVSWPHEDRCEHSDNKRDIATTALPQKKGGKESNSQKETKTENHLLQSFFISSLIYSFHCFDMHVTAPPLRLMCGRGWH